MEPEAWFAWGAGPELGALAANPEPASDRLLVGILDVTVLAAVGPRELPRATIEARAELVACAVCG